MNVFTFRFYLEATFSSPPESVDKFLQLPSLALSVYQEPCWFFKAAPANPKTARDAWRVSFYPLEDRGEQGCVPLPAMYASQATDEHCANLAGGLATESHSPSCPSSISSSGCRPRPPANPHRGYFPKRASPLRSLTFSVPPTAG